MATLALESIRKVFDHARDMVSRGDGELLASYRSERNQDAFGSLVRRHGPMVLGVCRRVLRDGHSADDAFQATFLILARKADTVRPPERLGPWLYGVAYRTALKARSRAYRRQQVEHAYAAQAEATSETAHTGDTADLLPIIDEQLNALPEKYRTPLVLCGVQGLNKSEAATRLGLPEGTVSSRLARAREMLRDRLTRRGVVVPAAGFATVLTADTLQAAVPLALLESAVAVSGSAPVTASIFSLSQEVMRSMSLLKFKILGAITLAASLASGGFGLVAINADEKKPATEKAAVRGEKPGEQPEVKRDGEKPAQPGNRKKRAVTGFVGSVDTKASTVALLRMGEGGLREDIFKLSPSAKVTVDGKEVKLDTVPKGTTAEVVVLSFAREGGALAEASELNVDSAKLVWVVKEANATSVTLLGGGRESKLEDRVIKLAADAKVIIDGKDAKPAELQAGDVATIVLNADRSAATLITVGTKKPVRDGGGDGERPAARPAGFSGRIGSIDTEARLVTLAAKGEGGREVAVKLTADAKITIDGKPAKIGELTKGMGASFTVVSARDGQPREANEVVVAGIVIGGVVKQVDTTSVTVGGEKNDRVLKLVEAGKVMIGGKEAKLADLKAGDRVQVTMTSDESAAVMIVVGAKRVDGDKPRTEKGDGDRP